MNRVVRTKQKRIGAGLAEGNHGIRGVRVREVDRRWAGIQLPLDGSVSAWIGNCASERGVQTTDILICSRIHCRRARRPWSFVRPSRLNHLEITDVDGRKVVECG